MATRNHDAKSKRVKSSKRKQAKGKIGTNQEPQGETARRWERGGTGAAAQNSSVVLPAPSGNNQ